jgi:DNA repair exonuclease SbcCD nuclease subunit
MVFTDLHMGLRHNSKEHNEDCMDYVNWFISEAKVRGAETCIFMGDFMHHRNQINSQTLEYAIRFLGLLNDAFEKVYFMVGNHDLYWRESRSITSMKFASLYPNIVLIDAPTVIGDVSLVPWLVEDEWKTVATQKSKYMFGHLELPGFKMNASVVMPDNGGLNLSHLENQDLVFTGHFHKRQTKGKVHYIGNPFGHNFSDVWDFERGAMCLEWGNEPEYLDYTNGPRFISINLSALLDNPEIYLKPKTYLQVILDLPISYEEAAYLRETFVEQYDVREFKLVRNPDDELITEDSGDITFQTVDQIVVAQLTNIESDTYDSKKLIEIYDRL